METVDLRHLISVQEAWWALSTSGLEADWSISMAQYVLRNFAWWSRLRVGHASKSHEQAKVFRGKLWYPGYWEKVVPGSEKIPSCFLRSITTSGPVWNPSMDVTRSRALLTIAAV